MTSTEISLYLDIVEHGNQVFRDGCFNPKLVSKADFTAVCTHLLRTRYGRATLFEYIDAPPSLEVSKAPASSRNPLINKHPLLVITALRLIAASKLESEIKRAMANGLPENSEEVMINRWELADLLKTALTTAPELLQRENVELMLQRNCPRGESRPPSLAIEA